MKTVLILSPRFPPTSAADLHRVRMMLPTLELLGWRAIVLTVEPRYVEAPLEDELLRTIPANTEIISCGAISQRLTRQLGFGSLSLRAFLSVRAAGDRILRSRQVDLIFLSTTEFGLLPLGRRWKSKFGVPFVVDLQDPWVNSHYEDTGAPPPGGRIKHRLTQWLARRQEEQTLHDAGAIISVSPDYPRALRNRYRGLSADKFSVIPFGGSSRDFQVAASSPLSTSAYTFPNETRRHWVYAGTAPPGIWNSVVPFFSAMRMAVEAGILREDSVLCHFIGTDYAPPGMARPRIIQFAKDCGLERCVTEHPTRIGYFDVLRTLSRADALLIFGWDDPGYTSSKLFPYILAEKPLLAVLHEASSANEIIRETHAGVCVTFESAGQVEHTARAIFDGWFATRAFEKTPKVDWGAFKRYTAESMTQRVVNVFDSVVDKACD